MGVYLNPGNDAFAESLNSEIYVDKSNMIHYTNRVLGTKQKFICISRPRRFGKSITAEMISAYYDSSVDSHPLFSKLKIAVDSSFEQNINKYDVLFFNIQSFLSRSDCALNMVEYLEFRVIQELAERYPDLGLESEPHLTSALEKIYSVHRKGFVFIIDEWDCVFREKKSDVDAQTKYLDFLRDLLKDKVYVKLAYMTGILPIKKYGTHSALNMFDEFSMTNPKYLASYVGFTEEEVRDLCQKYNMDFEETRRWYDGYRFRKAEHIYSPKSVVDAMRNEAFDSYWTQTETYEALKTYIDMNFDGLKDTVIAMLGGGHCLIDTGTFQNDMTTFHSKDDALTLLIHLGYLAYDMDLQEVFIPNEEVRAEFARAIKASGWHEVIHAISISEELLENTLACNNEKVARIIDNIHEEFTSILNYNNEISLSCVISIAYYSARRYYSIYRELPSGKGFADLVYLPRIQYPEKPAMIIELKWDKTATGAIRQIKDKNYIKGLKNYSGTVLLVGINYNKSDKHHECLIETIQI